jgi:GTPase SAR1 family protein
VNKNYTLQVVEQLARKLDSAGIRFCHLKSSKDLGAPLAGHGDLDILISRDDSLKVSAILADLGFRHYVAPAWRHINGVAGFIGLDETAGKIVGVRTNYRLVMGPSREQEYWLPWEKEILDSAVPAPDGTLIPVPGAEAEMLMLLVCSCLEIRLRDRFFGTAFYKTLIEDLERNRVRLCDRIDDSKLNAMSDQWLHPDLWRLVKEATFSPSDRRTILRLRKMLVKLLAGFRTYGPMESFVRARLRELTSVFGSVNKRHLKWAFPWARTTSRGGAIICVLGADGSGKSTLTSEVVRWLSGQLGVTLIYMGSGDGQSSILRLPLKLLRRAMPERFLRKKADHGRTAKSGLERKTQGSFLLRMGLLVWGVVLAREKKGKLIEARRAANLGIIVVTDRYPQFEIFDFNDGPLLQDFGASHFPWLRAIARWELSIYQLAEQIRPDLVIKLMVSPETAEVISADLPLNEVIEQAKKAVWEVA